MTTKLPPPTTHPLFAGVAIEEAFAAQRAKVLAEIAALAPDDLLTGDLARLRTEIVETYRMRALRLDWDARSAEARAAAGSGGSGSGSTVVFVPFSGAPGLFDMTPTRRGGDHPAGFIGHAELVLVIAVGRADASRELERQIALITEWVARINADVAEFNRELSTTLRTRLAWLARRAREYGFRARAGGSATTRPQNRAGRTARLAMSGSDRRSRQSEHYCERWHPRGVRDSSRGSGPPAPRPVYTSSPKTGAVRCRGLRAPQESSRPSGDFSGLRTTSA